MLVFSRTVRIPDNEITITSVRAAGPGGQHVNKVSSAIQLRFDIPASSLPDWCKQRLLSLSDRRITRDGVLVIKAQRFRERERNRQDAIERLGVLVRDVMATRVRRVATRVPKSVTRKRLDGKRHRSRQKQLRGRVVRDE